MRPMFGLCGCYLNPEHGIGHLGFPWLPTNQSIPSRAQGDKYSWHGTAAMQKCVSEEFLPGPAAQSDEDFLDHIRQTAGTTYHPTSTCMMGQHERAVVDTELRVRGVEGLRVIDASIMPTVVSGNTNAAAIMVAEKGADMILAEARSAGSIAARAA